MKTAGIIITIVSSILLAMYIIFGIKANFRYSNSVKSYWSLADKSSTIPKKAQYIDKFVEALGKQNLEGKYNAIWLQTPDNSFDMNMEALKTLQLRLHEIEKMDVTSFQYQTAIQQITQQEQAEAGEMLSVFKGTWMKDNYFMLWDWICVTFCVLFSLTLIGGIILWNWDDLSY